MLIEVGTPLIKQEGMNVVTVSRQPIQKAGVFADNEDDGCGELEADICVSGRGQIMTVLGLAGDSTIAGAVKAARNMEGGRGRHDRRGRQTKRYERAGRPWA